MNYRLEEFKLLYGAAVLRAGVLTLVVAVLVYLVGITNLQDRHGEYNYSVVILRTAMGLSLFLWFIDLVGWFCFFFAKMSYLLGAVAVLALFGIFASVGRFHDVANLTLLHMGIAFLVAVAGLIGYLLSPLQKRANRAPM